MNKKLIFYLYLKKLSVLYLTDILWVKIKLFLSTFIYIYYYGFSHNSFVQIYNLIIYLNSNIVNINSILILYWLI